MDVRAVEICVLLLCIWTTSKCSAEETQSAFITITPSTLTLEHNMTSSGGAVTISCTGTPGDGALNLFSLRLRRVLDTYPNSTPTTLLNILHHNLSPQVVYPIEGSSAYGSVTQNFLTLSLTRTQCGDAGVYMCEAAYLNTNIVTFTANSTLSVEVNPGQLSVTAKPDFQHWVVNNTVTLTCAGPLGTADSGARPVWHWEYWDTDKHDWRSYEGPASDVSTKPTNQRPCYVNGTTTLQRRLQLADSERVYRCYVERNDVTFQQFAGTFQLGSVMSASVVTAKDDSSYNTGITVGVGIGVAATVTVVVIVAVIVLMCLWKRSLLHSDGGTKDSIVRTPENSGAESNTRSVALQTDMSDEAYDVLDNSLPAQPTTSTVTMTTPPATPGDDSVVYDTVIDIATAQQHQAAAEDVLYTLLATRHVISWKVNGEGGYTTFTLHLAPSATHTLTYLGPQQGRWRKKSAATLQQQQTHQRVALPHEGAERLALPDVPSAVYENLRH